jgi:hypothetical protein
MVWVEHSAMDRMHDSAALQIPAATARILQNGLPVIRLQIEAASGCRCLSIKMGSKPMRRITVSKQFNCVRRDVLDRCSSLVIPFTATYLGLLSSYSCSARIAQLTPQTPASRLNRQPGVLVTPVSPFRQVLKTERAANEASRVQRGVQHQGIKPRESVSC